VLGDCPAIASSNCSTAQAGFPCLEIPSQKLLQFVKPKASVANLDFQQQSRCGQLVVEVQGRRSLAGAQQLQVA
jgi:hypothetical protein